MFILKLSTHFCTFQENIESARPTLDASESRSSGLRDMGCAVIGAPAGRLMASRRLGEGQLAGAARGGRQRRIAYSIAYALGSPQGSEAQNVR